MGALVHQFRSSVKGMGSLSFENHQLFCETDVTFSRARPVPSTLSQYLPFDFERFPFVFAFPYIVGKCCAVSVLWVGYG